MFPMGAGQALASIPAGIAIPASIAVTTAAGCVAERAKTPVASGLNQKKPFQKLPTLNPKFKQSITSRFECIIAAGSDNRLGMGKY